MASEFIGFTVLVTLQSPPDAKIQGVVADVHDQSLILRDVTLLWSGQRIPTYAIKSYLIADLEVAPAHPPEDDLITPTASTPQIPSLSSADAAFHDPAILSFSKRNAPRDRSVPAAGTSQPLVVSPVMIADGEVPSPASHNRLHAGESSVSSITTTVPLRKAPRKSPTATATLTEPFDALALNGSQEVVGGQEGKTRKTKRKEGRKETILSRTAPGIIDLKDITNGPLPAKKGKGKGWRQTPIIEETAPKHGQKSRRARKAYVDDANGWATEDATDIQDMGEFDFETNHLKFNKRQVFDDIRKEDNTAEDDRLVSFNRKARPGTNGGRSLHFTENVLDPEPNTEAGETEDEIREDHYSSGRGSKRAGSKKPPVSRKGSLFPGGRTESPRPLTRLGAASPMNGSVSGGANMSFRMAKTNKPCHAVSPLQMLEIEQLCTSELGLTEEMLAENAGRGIAETVMKKEPKNVVFLVGNHKSGARAIVAARHLRSRRLRITVVLLGGEREEMLLEPVRKQLSIYRKASGFVDRWDEYSAKLAVGPQPDAIIDSLLGIHMAFDEMRTDDQAVALEMIRWTNRSTATTYSVDVPSGLSATTGAVTKMEGGDALVMNAAHILCLASPKVGLVNTDMETNWQVSVIDIGIPSTAWHKYGSRRKHGVEFGSEWVVQLQTVMGSG